jgi:hypothetical protein
VAPAEQLLDYPRPDLRGADQRAQGHRRREIEAARLEQREEVD